MPVTLLGVGENIPGLVIVAAGSVNIWAAFKLVYYAGSIVQRFKAVEEAVRHFDLKFVKNDDRLAALERSIWKHGARGQPDNM